VVNWSLHVFPFSTNTTAGFQVSGICFFQEKEFTEAYVAHRAAPAVYAVTVNFLHC
jgi:hypothetical protein